MQITASSLSIHAHTQSQDTRIRFSLFAYNHSCRFGPIVSAKAVQGKEGNTCRGYGFVLFKDHASAARAVAGMRGGPISCSFARVRVLALCAPWRLCHGR